jgi:hypothetical protein
MLLWIYVVLDLCFVVLDLCYFGFMLFWIYVVLDLCLVLSLDFVFWLGKFVVSGSATAGHHHF